MNFSIIDKQSKKLMIHYHAKEGKIIFSIVRKAFNQANIQLKANDPEAVLIWYDTLRDIDYYSTLRPWQVLNRIPNINYICRKAYLIRLLQRMSTYYPSLYKYYPLSFVLPNENARFAQEVSKHKKKYIVKPDGGSLGIGISIISENDEYTPNEALGIAQEYLPSALIDDTKFDLRVYALISSANPLTIYVFRDGVARFCSMKSGTGTIYSQLTNTALNKKNPEGVNIDQITQMISTVFDRLKRIENVDTDLVWKKIDNIIILTVLSTLKYIDVGMQQQNVENSNGYNRCFQILGFDVMLGTDWSPILLEVNFRPSLEGSTDAEREMKMKLLTEALSIAAPLDNVQQFLKTKSVEKFTNHMWDEALKSTNLKSQIAKTMRDNLSKVKGFSKIYPCSNAHNQKVYNEVTNLVMRMPISGDGKLPCLLKKPKELPEIDDIVFEDPHPSHQTTTRKVRHDCPTDKK